MAWKHISRAEPSSEVCNFLASKERLILLQVIRADVSRGELFAPKADIDEPLSVS